MPQTPTGFKPIDLTGYTDITPSTFKPIDLTGYKDVSTKKPIIQPGKSHGWLADKAWNIGKGALDLTGITDSDLARTIRSGQDTKAMRDAGYSETDIQDAKTKEQNDAMEAWFKNIDKATHSPWEGAKAAANYLDPTGTVPGYMGLGEQMVGDVKEGNWSGLAGHTALGALPFVAPAIFKGAKKVLGYGAKPSIVPPVEPIAETPTYSGPRQLTGRTERLALPAIGETTNTSPTRFYQGKAGIADITDRHHIDWTDPSKADPNIAGTLHPHELGEITPAIPMDVAERGYAGLGKPVNRATLNPDVGRVPELSEVNPDIRKKQSGNIFPVDQMIESDLPFKRKAPGPNQIIGTRLNKLDYPTTPAALPYGTVNQSQLVPKKPFKIHPFTDAPYDPLSGLGDVPAVEKPFEFGPRDTAFPKGKTRPVKPPEGTAFEQAMRDKEGKVPNVRLDELLPSAEKTKGRTLPPVEIPKSVEALGLKDPNKLTVTGIPKGKSALELLKDSARKAESTAKETPKATTAPGKEPGVIKANYASSHTTLLNNPLTEKLVRPILEALDKKQQWIRSRLEEASPYAKGLSKGDRKLIGEALSTGDTSKLTPEHTNRVNKLKDILSSIDKESPTPELIKTKGIEDHFAEPEKKGILKSAIDLFRDKEIAPGKPKTTNYDIRNALPKYLESAGRDLFDKPAIDIAKGHLENLPAGSKIKDLADWYIKDYEKSGSGPLAKEAGSFASKAANLTARSVVDLNPGLHALHLGELPTTVLPKIGLKNTLYGMKEVLKNPVKAWNETSKLGLISDEVKPYAFKTKGEKYRSAAYLFNSAEKFVKGTGYSGAKKMFLDQGLSESVASQKALELTKDMTLDTGPARRIKGLSNKSDTAGGAFASRLGGQFKGTPIKLAEQLGRTLADTKANPGATAKMLAGTLGTIEATKAGAHMFHLNPSSLLKTTMMGPFGETLADTGYAAYRGDYESAVENLLAGTIPGGRAAKKIYESLTNQSERDKEKRAAESKETKSGHPPADSLRRIFDYMSK